MGVKIVEVVLDPIYPVYFPGQAVTGYVRLDVESDFTVNGK